MATSVPNRPKTLFRNENNIVLNWKDLDFAKSGDLKCNLQIFNDLKEWQTIYRGTNTQYQVENLAPCTGYNFRIAPEDSQEWLYFKGATECIPFYVLHMTRAVKLGKSSLIRSIAQSRPDLLEIENKENKTPLVLAIEQGDLQVVVLLINLGARVNKPLRFNKRTPLMVAIYRGCLQIASVLIDKGANVNATDVNCFNILHYAVDSNSVENVKFTFQMGIDVNSIDSNGWTPLLRAVILNCDEALINALLEKGANKTIKDRNGFDYEKHCTLK